MQFEQFDEKKHYDDSSDDEPQVRDNYQGQINNQDSSESSIVMTPINYRTQLYNEILNMEELSPRSRQQMINVLQLKGITYKEDNFNESAANQYEICISKISSTKNYEIVNLTVSVGVFQQQVTILNVFRESFFNHKLAPLFFQSNTNIYHFTYRSKEFICKSTSYSDHHSTQADLRKEEIIQCLREYCITNIMSCLRIGPKVSKYFHYDMVVSQSGVQFYLEHCLNHAQRPFNFQDALMIKTSLKQMHMLGFVHRDIKPGNIMYSKEFGRFVYIDFGISEWRREKPGQLVRSKFLGTYAYCTDQFKRLFNSRQYDSVDIHLNDAWGLKLSINHMSKSLDREALNEDYTPITINQIIQEQDLMQRQIKYLLYVNEIEILLKKYDIKSLPLDFQRKILDFLYQIPATQSIRKFYLFEISQVIKKEIIFSQLWECFKIPVYFQSYKGTRMFLKIQEQKSNARFQHIYSKIKNKYSNIVNDSKIIKREHQQILSCRNPLNQNTVRIYQKRLIQYISFKNLKWETTLKQKYHFCKMYIELYGLQFDLESLGERQLIEQVLKHLCESFLHESHIKHWDTLIKAIQNYFIMAQKLKIDLVSFLKSFIINIIKDSNLSNLKKIKRMFDIIISRKYLLLRSKCLTSCVQTIQLEKFVYEKINQIIKYESLCNNKQLQIFQFLKKYFFIYKIEPITLAEVPRDFSISDEIKSFRINYPELRCLLSFTEFYVGLYLEKYDRIDQGRRIHQQKHNQLILTQNQINILNFELIRAYEITMEFKKVKKHFKIVDQAINCMEISCSYFTWIRIFLAAYLKDYQLLRFLLKFTIKQQLFKSDQYFETINIFQWSWKLKHLHSANYIQLPSDFTNYLDKIQDSVYRATQSIQKRLEKSLVYRKSNYFFYLRLLNDSMLIEYKRMGFELIALSRLYAFQQAQTKSSLTNTPTFNKLLLIPRQKFTNADHTYMILIDLLDLKKQKKYIEMLNYIKSKDHEINQIFQTTDRADKSRCIKCFSLVINSLGYLQSKQQLNQFIEFIIPYISSKNAGMLYFVEEFQENIVEALIKTEKYDFIMEQLMEATNFYSYNASSSNNYNITKLYSNVTKKINYFFKESQIVNRLKTILPRLNPKVSPFFSIFLLFFIYPCNRKKIIKYIYLSLDYINHQGKQYILSRLYKQLGKIKGLSIQRRRYLIKKDLRQASLYTVDLNEMKLKLNVFGQLRNFEGQFLQTLERKLITLGKCCEIYSQVRVQNGSNKVVDQLQLERRIRQQAYQKWQQQTW